MDRDSLQTEKWYQWTDPHYHPSYPLRVVLTEIPEDGEPIAALTAGGQYINVYPCELNSC